jgi:hypothetical protein
MRQGKVKLAAEGLDPRQAASGALKGISLAEEKRS